jgi:MYXO-CTERM domain-containing protein
MPYAERIEEFPSVGASIVLVDNTERINSQLKAWNDSQGWPPATPSMPSGSGGASMLPGGGTGVGGQGGFAFGNDVVSGGGDGCSCSIGQSKGQPSSALVLAGVLALVGARRRKRS